VVSKLAEQLEKDGIALLPDLLGRAQLTTMQKGFEARLSRPRWNDFDGYERTEPYRHMIQDVLTLDQGFVDAALDQRVTEAVRAYVGPTFELVEAKGWKSLPTRRNFHGWHGDSWYDQARVQGIPRELKLGIYLSNVCSGAFTYVKGTHGRQAPRSYTAAEAEGHGPEKGIEVLGPAGSAFLFDTSGIHRQNYPILEERNAVFLTYHDPAVPLQPEDIDYYRYHPLLLNAAFLGNLTQEHQRILGFGNQTNFIRGFQRRPDHGGFQAAARVLFGWKLRAREWRQRVGGKVACLFGRGGSPSVMGAMR
jgi:hypothetical protein